MQQVLCSLPSALHQRWYVLHDVSLFMLLLCTGLHLQYAATCIISPEADGSCPAAAAKRRPCSHCGAILQADGGWFAGHPSGQPQRSKLLSFSSPSCIPQMAFNLRPGRSRHTVCVCNLRAAIGSGALLNMSQQLLRWCPAACTLLICRYNRACHATACHHACLLSSMPASHGITLFLANKLHTQVLPQQM
jgi:hypothetical protein